MNVSVVQEPLAFILPKREPVFCLDKELAELPAPAPALPPEAPSPEPVTPAVPDAGQEEVESAGPPQPDEPSAGIWTGAACPPGLCGLYLGVGLGKVTQPRWNGCCPAWGGCKRRNSRENPQYCKATMFQLCS